MKFIKMAKGANVRILDQEMLRRRNENKKYLLELENDNLLLSYTLEAGIFKTSEIPKNIHGGWESPLCELRGHFLGHWLSAAAMHFEATKDGILKAKADELIDVIAQCQKENGGKWAASIPEKYLYWIGNKKPVWAPQYTIHKTFMGLLDMYEYAGNEKALEVAIHFGEWFYEWSGQYTKEHFQEILDVETGGMLEIWVILYRLSKKEIFKTLMERYYRNSLFDALLRGEDVLTNMHSNTTIPEILGAAAAYEVTGEEKWLDIVTAYWKSAVTKRGSYATGGQTCGEIWSPKQALHTRLGDKNQEHCTVYNMMRLADFLFCHTLDVSYMDYWERNLYNGIMAQGYWRGNFTHGKTSDFPTEGLLTYFLPLRAGGQKAWSSKTQDFFCCHGSLVQANAAHNKGIYYEGENSIYVCQYFNSDYQGNLGEAEVTIKQKINSLNGNEHTSSDSSGTQKINKTASIHPHNPQKLVCDLQVNTNASTPFTILIRVPWWVREKNMLLINGEAISETITAGSFIAIKRVWKEDSIHIEFSKRIQAEYLPGCEHMAAFLDGPVVLAGLCEHEKRLYVNPCAVEDVLTPDNEREWSLWQNTYKTINQDIGIPFIPLYQVGYEKYQIYFPLKELN